jgi:hypothetical protein
MPRLRVPPPEPRPQVAANISEVDRGAAETKSASAQVLSSAASLARESARLKAEVNAFLRTIRAASSCRFRSAF